VNRKLAVTIGLAAIAVIIGITLVISRSGNPLKFAGGGSAEAKKYLIQARELESKGKLLEAKAFYQRLINEFGNAPELGNWQKKLEELNIKLLFSPVITPGSATYGIKPGDTLGKIAKEFNTTVELIRKNNSLSDDKIIPGRKIKVWTAPFTILVDKSLNVLILKSNEEVFKTYIASTGANNSTPTGTFKIVEKLPNPTWFKAGAVVAPGSPENVLGTRWLGFNLAGYGIHGTIDPQSLGKQVTQGCVRLSNSDVEELYTIVPKGTEVTIVD
jgi:lipoprotein-anchoring transpeptidase ErfK/SrfK